MADFSDFLNKVEHFQELESGSMRVNTLSGLFPVCIKCRKVGDEEGYWQKIERYLKENTDAEFRKASAMTAQRCFVRIITGREHTRERFGQGLSS